MALGGVADERETEIGAAVMAAMATMAGSMPYRSELKHFPLLPFSIPTSSITLKESGIEVEGKKITR